MTDKFFAAPRTGTALDIMTVLFHRVLPANEMGSLAKLDQMKADNRLLAAEGYADMAQPYQDYGMKDGVHYQTEHSRCVAGIVYNTEMFNAAGLNAAEVTTWDDFLGRPGPGDQEWSADQPACALGSWGKPPGTGDGSARSAKNATGTPGTGCLSHPADA